MTPNQETTLLMFKNAFEAMPDHLEPIVLIAMAKTGIGDSLDGVYPILIPAAAISDKIRRANGIGDFEQVMFRHTVKVMDALQVILKALLTETMGDRN